MLSPLVSRAFPVLKSYDIHISKIKTATRDEREMNKGSFVLDAFPSMSWEGFTDGSTWNGWENPSFTRETIDSIIPVLNTANSEHGDGLMTHRWDGDVLYVLEHDYEEDGETAYNPTVLPDGSTVYSSFSNGWCWHLEYLVEGA